MHIKTIELCGFKSYKDRLTTEPFSPKINVVVGANGSGKSNFFHAIRFLLNDVTQMRAEERQQLLHEGSGHAVPTAYVEVVFDNSDGRFPIDKDEVRLRRTISKSKDEYHLDKKPINKSEVGNLLESAGFSRANPYYIVQQGKIMHMSHMRDSERLSLLKEIGGTGVYEERRKESLKVMSETETRRHQIEEMMSVIEAKLGELDGERKELAEYMVLDKQRRCLEYSLADAELSACRADLSKVQTEQQAARMAAGVLNDDCAKAAADLAALDAEAEAAASEAHELRRAAGTLGKRRDAAAEGAAAAEAEASDLERTLAQRQARATRAAGDADTLAAQIKEAQAKLEQARAAASTAEAAERSLRSDVEAAELRLQALCAKQGRSKAFGSARERDAWVQKEVSQLEGTIDQESARAAVLANEVRERNEELNALAQSIGDRDGGVRTAEEAATACEKRLAEIRLERDKLQNSRKEVWRSEAELRAKVDTLQGELRKRKMQLDNAVARDISRGLAGLERVVSEHAVVGVYGRLIDLIDCPPQLSTAVEVTAGNSLFHVVVESDDVALRCTELLNRTKAGRVTFMPLNTLQPKDMSYPTGYGTDVVALAKKVKCDARFDKAVQQVFGKVVLCRNVDLATSVAHVGAFDCVTMDGIQVSKRGAMTGGYHEPGSSRLDHMKAIRAASSELAEAQASLAAREAELVDVDARINALSADLHKEEISRQHQRSTVTSVREELKQSRRTQGALQKELDALEREAAAAGAEVAKLRAQVTLMRSELGTALQSNLSAGERGDVASLPTRIDTLKEQLKAARATAAAKASARSGLESLLADDLVKRRDELQEEEGAGDLAADNAALEGRRAEAAAARKSRDTLVTELHAVEKRLEGAAARLADVNKRRGALVDAEGKRGRAEASGAGSLEVLASRRSAFLAREADLQRRIRELGSLPADAFEKYAGKKKSALLKQLDKVTADLTKFGSVNRKALDQYTSFTEQREELGHRKTELDKSEAKIRELIAALDMRKDEAIERTFKGVAKHFRDVFSELVPSGKGELVMQKRLGGTGAAAGGAGDDDEGGSGGGAGGSGSGTAGKYSGVKVRISFTKGGETMSLKQLSGGQRTLVAMSLIFAIQRCDPAPFYLFDEIDAALDPQYRTTVAQMLRRQADDKRSPAQFIVTTFHPQIVIEADNLMGVGHTNRVSRVFTIARDEALAFLQAPEDAADEQRAGPSGAAAGARGGGSGGAQGGGGGGDEKDEGEEEGSEEEEAEGRGRRGGKGKGGAAAAAAAKSSGAKGGGGAKGKGAKAAAGGGRRKRGRADEGQEEEEDA
ncbi:hypothetical protein FOA52_000162 [Chlamydomonas sp. UWO 241]|nr:hypothetical protein FOA52_000162 [Chlamydomonas sp. UWO 241]